LSVSTSKHPGIQVALMLIGIYRSTGCLRVTTAVL